MCLIGAIIALILFSYVHDREIVNLEKKDDVEKFVKDNIKKISQYASQV